MIDRFQAMNKSPSSVENISPFWVGIRKIYQKDYWGYRSSGKKVPSSLFSQNKEDGYSSECAAIDGSKLVRKYCKHELAYVCETGNIIFHQHIVENLHLNSVSICFGHKSNIYFILDGLGEKTLKRPGKYSMS